MNMNDHDAELKAQEVAARRSVAAAAAKRAARPSSAINGGPSSSRPGAVSVAAKEAARLDERIAQKSSFSSLSTFGNATEPAPASNSSAASGTTSTSKLSQLERDVQAKLAAKPPPGTSTTTTFPGAVAAPAAVGSGLTQLERDVQAKITAHDRKKPPPASAPKTTRNTGVASSHMLQGDIELPTNHLRPDKASAPPSPPGSTIGNSPNPAPESPPMTLNQGTISKKDPPFFSSVGASPTSVVANLDLHQQAKNQALGIAPATDAVYHASQTTTVRLAFPNPNDVAAGPLSLAPSTSQPGLVSTQVDARINEKLRTSSHHYHHQVPSRPQQYSSRAELESLADAVDRKLLREQQQEEQEKLTPESTSPVKLVGPRSTDPDNKKNGLALAPRESATCGVGTGTKNITGDRGKMLDMAAPTAGAGDVLVVTPREQAPNHVMVNDQGVIHQISVAVAPNTPDVEYVASFEPPAGPGLAVAMPVTEEHGEYLPNAVEYDVDAKPPVYKTRRFRFSVLLVIALLVAVATGSTVGVILSRGSSAISGDPRKDAIDERVARVVGEELAQDEESAYFKALQWIKDDDPQRLFADAENFVQRFTLAYLFFETTRQNKWKSCNPPDPQTDEDETCIYKKLIGLFPETYQELPGARWLSAAPECRWAGVVCDELSQVRALDMNGQGMNGPFPAGLLNLVFMQSFSFAWNALTGTLPTDLSQLKHLTNIELQNNQLSGILASGFWDARNVVRINLSNNKFTGSIPPEIANMKDLKGIFLQRNEFTGPLPIEMGELRSLSYIRLSRNSFSGQIPAEIFSIPPLVELWFNHNLFSGTIPTDIQPTRIVQDIRFHSNPNLSGSIPDVLFTLPRVWRLQFHNCNFAGEIPKTILNAPSLADVRFSGNPMVGTVPAGLDQLTDLRRFHAVGTNLTGPVPPGLCASRERGTLRVLAFDCAVNSDGTIEFECDCCTECCNAEGEECAPAVPTSNQGL